MEQMLTSSQRRMMLESMNSAFPLEARGLQPEASAYSVVQEVGFE